MKKNYESMRTVCRNFNFEPYDDFEYEELIIPDDRFAQSEMLIARNCRYSLDDAKTRLRF